MSDNPDWRALRGSLVHRAVLHPGGRWFPIATPAERQNYITQVLKVAKTLTTALTLAHELPKETAAAQINLVGSLIDHGGPAWGDKWTQQYLDLSITDQKLVCLHAELLSSRLAQNLMFQAEVNDWHYLLTEVSNPLKLVNALRDNPAAISETPDPLKEETDHSLRGVRGDLLTVTGKGKPFLIEVKTGQVRWDKKRSEREHAKAKTKYDLLTAAIFGDPVDFWMVRAQADETSQITWFWTDAEGRNHSRPEPEQTLQAV